MEMAKTTEGRLDWEIKKESIIIGDQVQEDIWALTRDDNGKRLGIFTDRYVPMKNEAVFTALEEMNIGYELCKAGELQGGKKVFFQFCLDQEEVDGQAVALYATVVNSHDGKTNIAVGATDTVISCMNTFFQFYKSAAGKQKHTGNVFAKLQFELEDMIENTFGMKIEQYKKWSNVSDGLIIGEKVIMALEGIEGFDRLPTHEEMLEIYNTRKANRVQTFYNSMLRETDRLGDTAWGAFNGLTWFTNHEMKRPDRDNSQLENIMIGKGQGLNERGKELITQLVG